MECNNHPNLGNACTVFSYTQNQQQQKSNSYCLNPSCFAGLSEPLAMTRMKSSVRTKGTRSLLMPNFFFLWSRKCPKSMWKTWRGERTLQFHNGGGWFSTQCKRPEEERELFSFTMVVADSQLSMKDLKRREHTSVSQWWWLISSNEGRERERCRDTDRDWDRELFCFPHNTVRSSEWRENHVFQMSALTTGWLLQPLITHPPQWPQGDHHRHW